AAAAAGRLLVHPYPGDLRMREHAAGHGHGVAAAQLLGVEDVVAHDPLLMVGDVLELVGAGEVAEGPQPLEHLPAAAHTLVRIDLDPAVHGGVDPCGGDVQQVRV